MPEIQEKSTIVRSSPSEKDTHRHCGDSGSHSGSDLYHSALQSAGAGLSHLHVLLDDRIGTHPSTYQSDASLCDLNRRVRALPLVALHVNGQQRHST